MADATRVERALALAVEAHAGQTDKLGQPYILHVIRVWQAVREVTPDEYVHIAALLHDVVEDTPVSLSDIMAAFGSRISMAVDALTKRGVESLDTYMDRVIADPIAIQVKRYDTADNYRRIPLIDDEATQARLEEKYHKVMHRLREASEHDPARGAN